MSRNGTPVLEIPERLRSLLDQSATSIRLDALFGEMSKDAFMEMAARFNELEDDYKRDGIDKDLVVLMLLKMAIIAISLL